jgi:CRP-like cAMP-binding protein
MEQTLQHHRALPPGAAGRLTDHIGMLCHSDDLVLRACARTVARRMGSWTLPQMEDDMSDGTVKRMLALEGVEIFAQSDVDDVAAVAQMAREHHFKAGETIYEEGDPGDALYVIVSGKVDAYRHGEKVVTVEAKQAFGDTSLLDGSPRPTQMIAVEETTVLVIDRREFMDLVSDRPEILQGIFRVLSKQLRQFVDLAASR